MCRYVLVTPVNVNKWEDVLHWFDLAEITFLSGVSMYSRLKWFHSAFCKPITGYVCDLSVDQTVFICKSNMRGTNANVSVCCRLSWSLNVGTVTLLHLCLVK